jgi:hypothetical protein
MDVIIIMHTTGMLKLRIDIDIEKKGIVFLLCRRI